MMYEVGESTQFGCEQWYVIQQNDDSKLAFQFLSLDKASIVVFVALFIFVFLSCSDRSN